MIIISKFSGTYDLYDNIFSTSEDLTNEELFERFKQSGKKIYHYIVDKGVKEELTFNSIKDLIPYYPYCIGVNSNNMMILGSNIVNREEKETLEVYLKIILKYYNRAKRKKEPFNKDEVLSKVCWNHYNEDIYKELIDRVDKYGKKATIDGLETSMAKYYRNELKEELKKI